MGSRGPGARNSVGPSAMVRPNVCQLGRWKPSAGSGAEPRRQTHFGNNILKIGWKSDILAADLISDVVAYGKSRYPSRLYEICHQETTVIIITCSRQVSIVTAGADPRGVSGFWRPYQGSGEGGFRPPPCHNNFFIIENCERFKCDGRELERNDS